VQVKARIASADSVLAGIAGDQVTVIRAVRYHQFDTYFSFADPAQGLLRYREDEFLDEKGAVTNVRARLTLTGLSHEAVFGPVALFRSRFFAPATHSLRFYREYFKPVEERDVEKVRRRWQVVYRGVEFYVHLDQLLAPTCDGYFLELKSRTWSRRDAQDKAEIMTALLARFGARQDDTLSEGYEDLATPHAPPRAPQGI
jgi:5-methylthioadenosine/S-adenosylhomocysteine deaminase